jgi:hypothetical protein
MNLLIDINVDKTLRRMMTRSDIFTTIRKEASQDRARKADAVF